MIASSFSVYPIGDNAYIYSFNTKYSFTLISSKLNATFYIDPRIMRVTMDHSFVYEWNVVHYNVKL